MSMSQPYNTMILKNKLRKFRNLVINHYNKQSFLNMDRNIIKTRFGINENNLLSIVNDAKDYALSKGIFMRPKDASIDTRVPLAFCLTPSPFSSKLFQTVCELQPYLNYILHKISHSQDVIKKCMANAIEVDEFTRNTYKIYEAVQNDDQLSLGLIRSDYLMNSDADGKIIGIKQIENNVISTSFGGLAPAIRDLHRFVLDVLCQKNCSQKLPLNNSVSELAKGLVEAWKTYGNNNAVILVVVSGIESNISDQRTLEFAISDVEVKARCLRCTFREIRKTIELRNKTLFVNNKEVAVVYYRTAYMPDQYESEDWDTRLVMEQSAAVKCPSAGMHLAGSKTMQAYLGQPHVLEQYVAPDIASQLREVFAKQYNLNMGPDGDQAVLMATENPEKFVLKPEREGGGNNIYGEDIHSLLKRIGNSKDREAYILMERINAPSHVNCIVVKDTPPTFSDVISELGIYGVILGNKDTIHMNKSAGHLLRTKYAHVNETGVVAGFGALDSPYFE